MADKDNSGVLFVTTEKKSENSPDHTGVLTLGADVVAALAAAIKAGTPAKLSLSSWNNTGKASGKPYQGLRAKVFVERQSDPDDLFSK